LPLFRQQGLAAVCILETFGGDIARRHGPVALALGFHNFLRRD
jgi:hypothetical protein